MTWLQWVKTGAGKWMVQSSSCVSIFWLNQWLINFSRIAAIHGLAYSNSLSPGPWFDIKMSSYQYRKSHCEDKTILRPSYLHNGISYTCKTTSLYWIRAPTVYGQFGSSEIFTWMVLWHGCAVYLSMITPSNGNIFRVTGPLCGEFTGHRWIPCTKASDAELWCFLWSAFEQAVKETIGDAGDLRRHCTHYDITVMAYEKKNGVTNRINH